MRLCRFYLQGYCSKGDRCNFSHADPNGNEYDNHYSGDGSYIAHDDRGQSRSQHDDRGQSRSHRQEFYSDRSIEHDTYYQSLIPPRTHPPANDRYHYEPRQRTAQVTQTANLSSKQYTDFHTGLVEEMDIIEHGQQWFLSSFQPRQDTQCIPGLEDYSFEEVRWEYNKASSSGSLQQYFSELGALAGVASKRRDRIRNPDQEFKLILCKIMNKERVAMERMVNSGIFAVSPSPTTTAPSTVGFKFALNPGAQKPSPEAHKPASEAQKPAFTFSLNAIKPTNATTSTGAAPLFGSTSTSQAAPTFGSSQPQASVFGSNPAQASVFGSSPPQAPAFGSSPSQAQVFGSSPPQAQPFGSSPTQAPMFGKPPQAEIFGKPAASSLFGKPVDSMSISVTPSKPTVDPKAFPTVVEPTGLFGKPSSGLFGKGVSSSLPGVREVPSRTTYSVMSELSESDLEQFKAAKFTLASLPIKPPPKELC